MRKHIVSITASIATLGLVACAAPADEDGEATPVEAKTAEVEAPVEPAQDGTMTADEGTQEASESDGSGQADGLDQDGNPVDRAS